MGPGPCPSLTSESTSTHRGLYCKAPVCGLDVSPLITTRRICIAQIMPWQDIGSSVCPSVYPPHAGILSKRLYISSTFFHRNKRDGNISFKKDLLKAIRRQRWCYINDMLQVGLDQGDSKPFWRYVRAQRQDTSGM